MYVETEKRYKHCFLLSKVFLGTAQAGTPRHTTSACRHRVMGHATR